VEILEKQGKLERWEYEIIKNHTYYTYRILEPLEALSQITEWAAFHHERLRGDGYPFHLKKEELPLGSRIMAVADVFTALTEDRPYRTAMQNEEALSILKGMADNDTLDSDVVGMLMRNFDDVRYLRTRAEAASNSEYRRFTIITSPPRPAW
jgi:HD-GYP domain-containing protein (c-di-GMP phosphodiesterase class II)